MDEKTFKKRFEKMEKFLYENIFLKNTSISDTLKYSLSKHTKFIIFANLRFTLVYNCLLRAKEEKIFDFQKSRGSYIPMSALVSRQGRSVRETCRFRSVRSFGCVRKNLGANI